MNKKVHALSFVLCLLVLSALSVFAGFDESSTGTFDASASVVMQMTGQTTLQAQAKGYFKGNKIVMDFTTPDKKVEGKMLFQGDVTVQALYFQGVSKKKEYFFYKRWMLDFVNPDHKKFGGKKTKDVEVEGKKCEVYEYELYDNMAKKVKREDTICDGWFPAKIVADGWPMSGNVATITLSNLKTGETVADSVFDPPQGFSPMPEGQAGSPKNPMVAFGSAQEGSSSLPELPAGLKYCENAGPSMMTMNPPNLGMAGPMAAQIKNMMPTSFNCDGEPNLVAPFFAKQFDLMAASGWTFCKKATAKFKDEMLKNLEQNVKTAKDEQSKGITKWALDSAKGGNMQTFAYLSPAPKGELVMLSVFPGMKSEDKIRAAVMISDMDMEKMMAGMMGSMPNMQGMMPQMMQNARKEFEKMCN